MNLWGYFVINSLSLLLFVPKQYSEKVKPTANAFILLNYYPTEQPSTFYRTRTWISVISLALMPVTIGSI